MLRDRAGAPDPAVAVAGILQLWQARGSELLSARIAALVARPAGGAEARDHRPQRAAGIRMDNERLDEAAALCGRDEVGFEGGAGEVVVARERVLGAPAQARHVPWIEERIDGVQGIDPGLRVDDPHQLPERRATDVLRLGLDQDLS